MQALSITTAWNETNAFVRREAGLLFPVAFLLLSLPSALLQYAAGVQPGAQPEPGPWMLLIPVIAAASILGSLALATLTLQPGISVAEALRHAGRRWPATFAAFFLAAVGALFGALPFVFVAGLASALVGGGAGPSVGVVALVTLFLFGLLLFFWVRLMLVTPVSVQERLGPIDLLRRSWRLTRGRAGKLLGFTALMVLTYLVISLAVGAVAGILIVLIAGTPSPGSAASGIVSVINALLGCVFSVYVAVMIARIYAQLTGHGVADIFSEPTRKG